MWTAFVILIISTGSTHGGVSITTSQVNGFKTKESCLMFGKTTSIMTDSLLDTVNVRTICFKKVE